MCEHLCVSVCVHFCVCLCVHLCVCEHLCVCVCEHVWGWGPGWGIEVMLRTHKVCLRTVEMQTSFGRTFCDSGILSLQLTVSWNICADEIDQQEEENVPSPRQPTDDSSWHWSSKAWDCSNFQMLNLPPLSLSLFPTPHPSHLPLYPLTWVLPKLDTAPLWGSTGPELSGAVMQNPPLQ